MVAPSFWVAIFIAALSLMIGMIVGVLVRPLDHEVQNRLTKKPAIPVPVSVNYMFTRTCNYECGFCFHTATSSYVEKWENIQKGLRMLKDAGMKKINFAGGEPLLYPYLLNKMCRFCKEDLGLESVSIVTNGSKLDERFMAKTAKYIDIIAVSCDSFQEDTNVLIGRGSGEHLEQVKRVAYLCRKYNVKFKINTVVNRYNFMEDMNAAIRTLQPCRWKVFQVLIVEEENGSDETLRDARRFMITDAEYKEFCDRHNHHECFIPEPNNVMKSSYLMIDEYMRFLNKGVGAPTDSILKVGVEKALAQCYWDLDSFYVRGGIYDWTKVASTAKGCTGELMSELEY